MTICIKPTRSGCYQKVMLDCEATRNIGIIEKNGHLNIKDMLRQMLNLARATGPAVTAFRPTTTGATHGVGGVRYVAYHEFASPAAAKAYLSKWFTVVNC